MRKWIPLVLAAALLPLCAAQVAAQEKGDPTRELVSNARARDIALATVDRDLQAGAIPTWKGKAPSGLKVVSASQSNLGGKAAYIVAVQMMKSTGIVRLTLDAKTGAVIDRQVKASWDWGNAPAWFKAGENSPPPARR
ncbi:MAG TPA: hypothetical protein VF832_15730 [Longimicrobiales bacterium]